MPAGWLIALAYLVAIAVAVLVIAIVKTCAECRRQRRAEIRERRLQAMLHSPFEEPSTRGGY